MIASISYSTELSDEIWLRDLFLIKTHYGRLVYLAGFLNQNTGLYEHHAAKALDPAGRVSGSLKKHHEQTFLEWVSYSLERKMADIRLYIAELQSIDRVQLVDAWLRLSPYRNLVPASVQGPERQRHISDVEAILGLLRNVYGVASPDASA